MPFTSEQIQHYLDESHQDPSYFNEVVLGRGPYWSKQEEICRSVVDYPVTVVASGNSVGKTYCLAGICLWFMYTRKNAIVLTTSTTAAQLNEALWANIEDAFSGSAIPLGGKIVSSPHKRLMPDEKKYPLWYASGLTCSVVEGMSGKHPKEGEMLVLIDESSGVSEEAWHALTSTNPSRMLVVGNPLRPDGWFYELCRTGSVPGSNINYIHIPSTASPDIEVEHSPTGLADAKFIRTMEAIHGRDSMWWRCHIDAEFPSDAVMSLIPGEWLDRCAVHHVPGGPVKIGIDYAEGSGGDESVICVKDDNGVYYLDGSNRWQAPELARRVKELKDKYKVTDNHIRWDASGTGSSFGNHLRALGIEARPFKGAAGTPRQAVGERMRDLVAWKLRLRLDPHRVIGVGPSAVSLPPFSIPAEILKKIRPEIQGLRYALTPARKIKLHSKDELKKLLGQSPDRLDALLIAMSA